jgi:DNA-binding transcriptional LysR family regulator
LDLFACLKAFVTVVDRGAFSRAAHEIGMSASSLTRQVDSLEEHLGVLLLNRSTRRLTLTDAGESYHEQAARILGELNEANRSVGESGGPPRGLLRVSLPVAFAQLHIAPAIPDFLRACPEVELDLILTDAMVNLVEERVDMAVRIGSLDSSSLIARKLAPQRRLVCASPDYLAARGEPQAPADLAGHNCLSFSYGRGDRTWRFAKGSAEQVIRIAGSIRANNSLLLRNAAVEGSGIILMPSWLVGDDIEAGRLRTLLTDWEPSPSRPGAAIHAVYLPNRRSSKRVRAFVDFLAARFGSPPYWDRHH